MWSPPTMTLWASLIFLFPFGKLVWCSADTFFMSLSAPIWMPLSLASPKIQRVSLPTVKRGMDRSKRTGWYETSSWLQFGCCEILFLSSTPLQCVYVFAEFKRRSPSQHGICDQTQKLVQRTKIKLETSGVHNASRIVSRIGRWSGANECVRSNADQL